MSKKAGFLTLLLLSCAMTTGCERSVVVTEQKVNGLSVKLVVDNRHYEYALNATNVSSTPKEVQTEFGNSRENAAGSIEIMDANSRIITADWNRSRGMEDRYGVWYGPLVLDDVCSTCLTTVMPGQSISLTGLKIRDLVDRQEGAELQRFMKGKSFKIRVLFVTSRDRTQFVEIETDWIKGE